MARSKPHFLAAFLPTFILLSTIQSASALTLEEQTLIYDSYALEAHKEIGKAAEKMVNLYQKEQNDYFVNLRLGWLFYLNQKYSNALLHYNRASNLVPKSIEPLLKISLIYILTEEYANVVKTCAQILQRDPKNLIALQRMITAQIRLKDFSQAETNVTAATEIYPTDATFLEQKAFIKKALGKTVEAKTTLSLLILISPSNEYARSQLQAK